MSAVPFWNDKHRANVTKEWSALPNFFIEEIIDQIPTGSRVLDLGAGTGRDSLYLAERGRKVVAADFSEFALEYFAEDATRLGVEQMVLSVEATPFPFDGASFDAVYAHLSLHYMPTDATAATFAEVARVLRGGGRFFALLNSVRDPELGTGREIEPSYFELEPGNRKRFFTADELPAMLGPFFRVLTCGYGTGTRKNADDQFVRLIAERT